MSTAAAVLENYQQKTRRPDKGVGDWQRAGQAQLLVQLRSRRDECSQWVLEIVGLERQ